VTACVKHEFRPSPAHGYGDEDGDGHGDRHGDGGGDGHGHGTRVTATVGAHVVVASQ
jgi:hypothetical protein